MRYYIIKVDGSVVTKSYKKPTLQEMQEAVGGYIEKVRLPTPNGGMVMYANEDGFSMGLALNREASMLYGSEIVGDVLVGVPERKAKP